MTTSLSPSPSRSTVQTGTDAAGGAGATGDGMRAPDARVSPQAGVQVGAKAHADIDSGAHAGVGVSAHAGVGAGAQVDANLGGKVAHVSMNAAERKERLARFKADLRSASAPGELQDIIAGARALFGASSYKYLMPDKRGMSIVARNVAGAALDEDNLQMLADHGVAHLLIRRRLHLERSILQTLLETCVRRLLDRIAFGGAGVTGNEIPLIDALLAEGFALPKDTYWDCRRILERRSDNSWWTQEVAELVPRIPSGVDSQLLGHGFRFAFRSPELVLRYVEHPAWSPEICRSRTSGRGSS